jgi:superoxide reductase
MEQKHVPLIEAPSSVKQGAWFNVDVKVGFMKEHPSTPGHWIRKIKLLVNRKEVAETEYRTGGMSASAASYRIRLEKTSTVEAVEKCNLHGTWISDEVTIAVV